MRAASVKIEWEEDGCYIVIDGDSIDPEYMAGEYRWRLEDPEQAYDAVRAGIGPWLQERDEALAEYRQYVDHGTGPAAAYFACKDPEGEWIRDVALGAMGVGESLEAAAAALDAIDLSRKMEKER
jgi:hypothetical protein